MSCTLRRFLFLMLIVVCGGVPAASVAAPQSDNGPGVDGRRSTSAGAASTGRDTPSLSVTFGPGDSDVLWPNRWGPITISLAGGSKPFSGSITVDYYQDGKPGGIIRRQVSCTPGKPTTIPVMFNPGRGCRHVGVTLLDQFGRQVDRNVFDTFPKNGPGQFSLPPLTDTSSAVVMGVGEPTGAARSVVQSVSQVGGTSAFGTTRVVPIGVDSSHLPTSWTGYDSLLLLTVDAEATSKADPRALAAIREWVSGGGRLVLFVNEPGTKWREWFGGADAVGQGREGFFAVDDASDGPMPDSLTSEIHKPLRSFATDRARALGNLGPAEDAALNGGGTADPTDMPTSATDPDAATPPGADSAGTREVPADVKPARSQQPAFEMSSLVPRRMIRLTNAGTNAGWKLRWGSGSADSNRTGIAKEGLLAEGPYGFGWLVVVGLDPNRVTATKSPQAICAMWTTLTQNALADWNVVPRTNAGVGMFANQPDQSLAGAIVDAEKAKQNVMERLAQVPILGNSVFYALAAALFVLALFLGPVDSLVLRRLRARQWSWATSLFWIALASLAALYIPNLLRSGRTQVNRVSVIDAIASSSVGGVNTTAPLAWRTSYTGVYASDTAVREFTQDAPGAWWRSVSARVYSPYRGRGDDQKAGPTTVSVQTLPDFSALDAGDPWAGMSLRGDRSDGTRLLPAVYKIWTFRTFMDQARVRSPIDASLAQISGSQNTEWTLTLTGVPDSAVMQSAAVKIRGTWHDLDFAPDDARRASNRGQDSTSRIGTARRTSAASGPEQVWFSERAIKSAKPMYYGYNGVRGTVEAVRLPGQLLALPGPDRRGMVADRAFGDASSSPEWAVVYLQLTGMPCDVTFGEDTKYSHDVIMRILVHVGAADATTVVPTPKDHVSGSNEFQPVQHDDAGGSP